MNELDVLVERLKKIGIEIQLTGNIPWIYLRSVNGNVIKQEDCKNANWGHCIGWYPAFMYDEYHINWHDIKYTFELIRKYK
jgi:hypothetical protein